MKGYSIIGKFDNRRAKSSHKFRAMMKRREALAARRAFERAASKTNNISNNTIER